MKYPNYLFEYIEDNKRLRAEVSEARTDHATAYANTVALAQECARLRAELANSNDAADKWRDLFVSNEKAIARVRELCDARDRVKGPVFTDYDETTEEFRAALEGSPE